MMFIIKNNYYISTEQLRTSTLVKAYRIVQKYPMHAADKLMDSFIQQHYNTSLKNLCIKLLLNFTFHKNDSGDLILVFKDPKYDEMARLITYGNGAIPGSKILQTALKN